MPFPCEGASRNLERGGEWWCAGAGIAFARTPEHRGAACFILAAAVKQRVAGLLTNTIDLVQTPARSTWLPPPARGGVGSLERR